MRRCVMFYVSLGSLRDRLFYVKSRADACKDVAGRVARNYTLAACAPQRIIARILRKQRVRLPDGRELRRRNAMSR